MSLCYSRHCSNWAQDTHTQAVCVQSTARQYFTQIPSLLLLPEAPIPPVRFPTTVFSVLTLCCSGQDFIQHHIEVLSLWEEFLMPSLLSNFIPRTSPWTLPKLRPFPSLTYLLFLKYCCESVIPYASAWDFTGPAVDTRQVCYVWKYVLGWLQCEWNQYGYIFKWDIVAESLLSFYLSLCSLFQNHLSRALASVYLCQCRPLSFETSLQHSTPDNFWCWNDTLLAGICRTHGSTNATTSAVWKLKGVKPWNRLGEIWTWKNESTGQM